VFLNFGGKTINKFFLNPPLDEKKKLIFDFSPTKKSVKSHRQLWVWMVLNEAVNHHHLSWPLPAFF